MSVSGCVAQQVDDVWVQINNDGHLSSHEEEKKNCEKCTELDRCVITAIRNGKYSATNLPK